MNAHSASGRALLLLLLAIGQTVGWGTTYYLPSVLAPALARDLGFSPAHLYGGTTLMLVIAALASPLAGRLIDQRGAARLLPVAPLATGLGQLVFAAVPGLVTWFAAWALFGLAMAFGMTLAANTLWTRLVGRQARGWIGAQALFSGLTPSLFWPLTAGLESSLGWRMTLLVYAVANLALVLPLQVLVAARWADGTVSRAPVQGDEPDQPAPVTFAPECRRLAIVATVLIFTAQGFVSWGLPLHFIALFGTLGLDQDSAVRIAAASGVAAVLARALDIAAGRRFDPIVSTTVWTVVLVPILVLLGAPVEPAIRCWMFTIIWSAANGVLAILRMTLPLYLFGPAGYGVLMGRMNLPQVLIFAASPMVFALVIERGGIDAALYLALAASVLALAAALVLQRVVRRAKEHRRIKDSAGSSPDPLRKP